MLQNAMLIKTLKVCTIVALLVLVVSTDAFAAQGSNDVFGIVTKKMRELFTEIRTVVFIVGGFGLVGLAVASIFGRPMWKWFALLAMGLVVVAVAGAVINYFSNDETNVNINDTLTSASASQTVYTLTRIA